MKIGIDNLGFEITIKDGVFGFSWWYPSSAPTSARDQSRIDLVGFSRDSRTRGPVTYLREVRRLHKD